MLKNERFSWKIVFVMVWLVFTLSMAGWWMYFSLDLVEHTGAVSSEIDRRKTMLLWEGAAWMAMLLAGGLTLAYFVVRERRQTRQIREFVAAFTHDLKTSLASLRLQVESLREDLRGTPDHTPLVERLAADTVRLQLQLENSMYLASAKDFKPFLQRLSVRKVLEPLKDQWPRLTFRFEGDGYVEADEKALTSILTNIIQNAVMHGQADRIDVRCEAVAPGRVRVAITDNGSGFQGDPRQLGTIFYRHNPSSGSGVGLFIVRQLTRHMDGQIDFTAGNPGFTARLDLKGETA